MGLNVLVSCESIATKNRTGPPDRPTGICGGDGGGSVNGRVFLINEGEVPPMSNKSNETFHNLREGGIVRQLAAGVTARVFPGVNAMLSVVTLEPHSVSPAHAHGNRAVGGMPGRGMDPHPGRSRAPRPGRGLLANAAARAARRPHARGTLCRA